MSAAPDILAEIDSFTPAMLALLDRTVLALAGAFERVYAEQPGLKGMRALDTLMLSIIKSGRGEAVDGWSIATGALNEQLARFPEHKHVDSAPETFDAQGLTGSVLDGIDAVMSRVAAAHLRQFRHLLLARSPYSPMPEDRVRAMYRNGAQVRIPDALFLVVRQGLLDHFNQARVVQLRNAGQSTAQLIHVDPEHATHGLVFTLVPGLDLPSYADIVAQGHLHPRANAIVGAR